MKLLRSWTPVERLHRHRKAATRPLMAAGKRNNGQVKDARSRYRWVPGWFWHRLIAIIQRAQRMIGNLLRAAFLVCFLTGSASAQTLALVGGSVYASPDAALLPDAVILASNGIIIAIGSRSEVSIPSDARVIDCAGKTVVAGFWNSHVHFTQSVWKNAGSAPAESLLEHMQEMLTKWGFTTVWDLGSDPRDSLPLRRRVNAGEVLGPTILFAGNIFPKGGHPAYLPAELQLPEAATADEATQMSRNYFEIGLDGIKLFTG